MATTSSPTPPAVGVSCPSRCSPSTSTGQGPYWFNDEEIAELYRESEAFQVQTAEMELLLRCFELPTTDSDCSYLTTTEILTYLGTYTRQPLKAKRMGEALKRVGYIKVSRRRNGSSPLYVYKIRKILPCPLLRSCSSM